MKKEKLQNKKLLTFWFVFDMLMITVMIFGLLFNNICLVTYGGICFLWSTNKKRCYDV